jgi:rod shape-determining protein MreC
MPSNWASALTLSKGTSSGVAIGNCVIDEYGYLVGVITDAGLNWSTVTTVIDPESQLGAAVFRTREPAVVSGDLRLMSQGKLKLDYVQGDLINGDLIVTSGLGGYFPPDLVIGTVEDVLAKESGMGKYAVLTAKTDPNSLSQVFIITGFDVVE